MIIGWFKVPMIALDLAIAQRLRMCDILIAPSTTGPLIVDYLIDYFGAPAVPQIWQLCHMRHVRFWQLNWRPACWHSWNPDNLVAILNAKHKALRDSHTLTHAQSTTTNGSSGLIFLVRLQRLPESRRPTPPKDKFCDGPIEVFRHFYAQYSVINSGYWGTLHD